MNDILLTNGQLFDKLKVHKLGIQHYAFSVFLFNENNELLLQKRAKNKYHSGSLWSNTCCSHFKSNEEFIKKENTAKNRLKDELGIFFNDKLTHIGVINYKVNVKSINAYFNNSFLIENEVDNIFLGKISSNISLSLDKSEVEEVKFIKFKQFIDEIRTNSIKYSPWLIKIIDHKDIMAKIQLFLQ